MATRDLQMEGVMERIGHLAAESAFEATVEEIREEMLDAGEDPKKSAERLKAKMLEASERGRRHRLKVMRKRWQRGVTRIQTLDHGLPATPDERKELLFMVIDHEPQLRQQITVQHQDLKDLSDADVTRYLHQLTELGALDDLWVEDDGEDDGD